jgi:ribose transport system permease protein
MSAATVESGSRRSGVTLRRFASRQGWTLGVLAMLIALLIVEANVAPNFTSFDIQSLVIAGMPLAFAAMAQAVVVISRGVDLSVGSVMALTNVIAARMMEGHGMGTAIAISVLVLAIGMVVGAINGIAVVVTEVPDIIVTLATSFVWGGVALLVLATPGGGSPADYQTLSSSASLWEWIPNGLLVLVIAYVLIWVPLRSRRLGLAIYAVGSDRDAAYLSGVRVGRTRILAYVVGGLFAALGGLALVSTTSIGSPLSGEFYTLTSVAAVVIGGVSLAGGKGGLVGPVLAAFILSAAVTVLTFLGVDANYGQVIQGALIVAMVMFGGLLLRRRES